MVYIISILSKTTFKWANYVARSYRWVDDDDGTQAMVFPAIWLWAQKHSSVSNSAISYEHLATLKLNLFYKI